MRPDAIADWATRFDLLGDRTRLRLLLHAHQHPGATVGDLAGAAGMSPSATSQALRVLREQGWVACEREGRFARYSLTDETVHEILHFMGDTHAGL